MMVNIGMKYDDLIILLELDAFQKYSLRLEKALKYLSHQERLRSSHILRSLQDSIDKDIEKKALQEMQDSILPRFFRNPTVVSLYAIFETAVIGIAPDPKKLEDIKIGGKKPSLVKRAKKYFNDIVKVSFCSDTRSYHQLEMLETLRHAISHCNGRLDRVKPKRRHEIEEWLESNIGVRAEGGDLFISENFIKETYDVVNMTIQRLIRQVSALSK